MRLTISTGDKRLSIKLPDSDCNTLFKALVSNALHADPVGREIKHAIQCGDVHEELTPIAPRPEKAILDKPAKRSTEAIRVGYTGFLYIMSTEQRLIFDGAW